MPAVQPKPTTRNLRQETRDKKRGDQNRRKKKAAGLGTARHTTGTTHNATTCVLLCLHQRRYKMRAAVPASTTLQYTFCCAYINNATTCVLLYLHQLPPLQGHGLDGDLEGQRGQGPVHGHVLVRGEPNLVHVHDRLVRLCLVQRDRRRQEAVQHDANTSWARARACVRVCVCVCRV